MHAEFRCEVMLHRWLLVPMTIHSRDFLINFFWPKILMDYSEYLFSSFVLTQSLAAAPLMIFHIHTLLLKYACGHLNWLPQASQ